MGDLNAKVDRDNIGVEEIMGSYGLGNRNENGELFVDFCSTHQLAIGGILFPHKIIYNANLGVTGQEDEKSNRSLCYQ